MPRLSDARPAAAAAAAAFRALLPFLPADERLALRRAFATHVPSDCLAMVVRVAENASAKHGARAQQSQSAVGAPLVADGLIGLSRKERGVWGGGVVNGWPDEKEWGNAWEGLYGTRSKAFVGGSGLDVNAPPFRMERALHGRAERL